MKKLMILSAFLGCMATAAFAQTSTGTTTTAKTTKSEAKYICPKCNASMDKPGTCAKCNAKLVKEGDYYCTGCGAISSKPGTCKSCNMKMVKMTAKN